MARVAVSKAKPVPPDAVRVWRGYRRTATANIPPAGMSQQDFLSALGHIFIPVTVQLQRLYGLTAYLPTVMPLDRPDGVPDEIALVFYESQQSYNDTKLIVTGRAYSALHATVFALPQSESGFPSLLQSELHFDTPYHLFKESADWQRGFTQVFVGTRPDGATPEQFAADLFDFFDGLRTDRPKGLDGAIVCATEAWVLYWEHWKSERASQHGRIAELPKLAGQVLLQPYAATPVPGDLAAHYDGLTVKGGESFNTQFPRGGATRPAAKATPRAPARKAKPARRSAASKPRRRSKR